nr:tyrosine-type recombinase/integrase [Terriglobales bacterium]
MHKLDAIGSKSVARRKFGFTKRLLDKLPLPANSQRAYFYDSLTRGLALAGSPAGKKVFVLYRKVAGRPERITIGPYPDLTIEQARGRAAELNGAIARGENPARDKRSVRDENTLAELFDKYLEDHLKPKRKQWASTKALFDLHLKNWRLRKISEIRRTDVIGLHTRIGTNSGKHTANRVVELLRALFNRAIAWEWNGLNPAAKVEAFPERERERFLQPDELPAFWKALHAEENETARDYILMSLLTGARRSNVQSMNWNEINFQAATWRIPEIKSKSGEAMTITLSAPALAILHTRKASSDSQFVFPGVGKSGHLIEPKSAWKRIIDRAGISDLRIHDLRRTLGSWQA